jgi:hypothetical protein
MRLKIRVLALGAVAVALVAGSGAALAASGGGKSATKARHAPAKKHTAKNHRSAAAKKKQAAAKKQQAAKARELLRGALANAVALHQTAKYLDMSFRDLRQELNGTTLAQVAEAHGKSAADLQAAIVAAFKAKLDQAVSKKKITQAQADKALGQYRDHVSKLMAKVWSAPAKNVFAAAAEYLGLTPEELLQQLPGTSLAALAEQQGKSVEGLQAAMVAAVKARLDRAVENKIVTADGAKKLLAKFEDRVDELVAVEWPALQQEAQDDDSAGDEGASLEDDSGSLDDDTGSVEDDEFAEDDGGSLDDEDLAADEDSYDSSADDEDAPAADE